MKQVRVKEALDLARTTFRSAKTDPTDEELEDMQHVCPALMLMLKTCLIHSLQRLKAIQIQGFWGCMSMRRFEEAFGWLLETEYDPREVGYA
jgi:hypothetical protein